MILWGGQDTCPRGKRGPQGVAFMWKEEAFKGGQPGVWEPREKHRGKAGPQPVRTLGSALSFPAVRGGH